MSRRSPLAQIKKAQLKSWAQRTAGEYLSAAIVNEGQNRIQYGHRIFAPTTASTQVTGAGATTVRVNLDYGVIVVDGALGELFNTASQADNVVATASPLLAAAQSIVIAIIIQKAANGTLSIVGVPGVPATTGTQVSPPDALIFTQIGSLQFVKLGETTINRTADTTLTQSYDNTKRDAGLFL